MTDNNAIALNDLRTLTADEINRALTFDEAIALTGLAEEDFVYLASPYRVIKGDEKHELVGRPFFIRSWRFAVDPVTEREYVVAYAVTRDNELVILTDGSTGIYAQLRALTDTRIGQGHVSPLESALVANGLRVSEYGLNADNKPAKPGEKIAGTGSTFYLG